MFIHDPDFYVYTANPEIIPRVTVSLKDATELYIFIKVVFTKRMNKPDDPCTSYESYSFTRCVADSVSARVGCRLELDSFSSEEFPICSSVKEILSIKEEYGKIWSMKHSQLIAHTKCLTPCSYADYQLATDPLKYNFGEEKVLGISFSQSHATERTEQLLYPLESFISEFGGALGLFLGFSFLMIWDAVEVALKLFLNKLKNL